MMHNVQQVNKWMFKQGQTLFLTVCNNRNFMLQGVQKCLQMEPKEHIDNGTDAFSTPTEIFQWKILNETELFVESKKGKVKGAYAERECILCRTSKTNQIKENTQIYLKI